MTGSDCPLTPLQIELLEKCVEFESTSTALLAEKLCLSGRTVEHRFAGIEATLGVHDRGGAIAAVLKAGWITLPDHDSAPGHEAEKYGTFTLAPAPLKRYNGGVTE
ncbi:MAG TPA: hypothetical protein VFJ58_07465 [Armatimonadota bacterium]|nr:hypothetical protein [Armatimonadota bacterium]